MAVQLLGESAASLNWLFITRTQNGPEKLNGVPSLGGGKIIGPGPPYVLEQFYFPLGKRKSEEFGTGT